MNEKNITVNNIEYIRKDCVESSKAEPLDGMEYVIVRTYSAGVHSGYLKKREGKEVTLLNARRFYQWYGSSTLSQFAQSGTSQPEKCKFPEEVSSIILTEAIEIIAVTEKAKKTIDSVKVWKS